MPWIGFPASQGWWGCIWLQRAVPRYGTSEAPGPQTASCARLAQLLRSLGKSQWQGTVPAPTPDQPDLFLSASALALQRSPSSLPPAALPPPRSYFPSCSNHHPLFLITQNELQLIRLEVILKGGRGRRRKRKAPKGASETREKTREGGFVSLKTAR